MMRDFQFVNNEPKSVEVDFSSLQREDENCANQKEEGGDIVTIVHPPKARFTQFRKREGSCR